MKNLRSLLIYLKPYKKWFFLAPLFLIFELIMDIFLPAIFGNVINIGVANEDINYIIISIVIMFVLTTLGLIGGIFSVYFSAKTSEYAANDIRKELFDKIISLNLLERKKYETGHFITVLTNDINLIANIIMISMRIFFRVPIIVVGSLIMAIILSAKLSLILIAVTPLLALITFLLVKLIFPKFLIIQESLDEINFKVREDINGIQTIKSLVIEDEKTNKFNTINLKLKNVSINANRFLNLQLPLTTFLVNVCIILILYFGGQSIMAKDGLINIGTILAFIQYLTNILYALIQASAVIVLISKSEASAIRVKEILNTKEDIFSKNNVSSISNLKFKNISFGFGEKNILENINFEIKKGEIIGITGLTGSGKSTLSKLISNVLTPTKGTILVNDMENININKHVAVASQTPVLLSGTIRENIKYSTPNVSDAKMRQYAKLCEIDDFILKQMGAYDFKLSAKGLNLSGGQRQRISLARTVLSDRDIIILDDALSSVDNETEKKILTNFNEKLRDKIIIIVSSKASTLLKCDKVMILDNGKIDDFANPNDLLNKNQIFQDMIGGDNHD